jgi:hypothetical protein
MNNEIRPISSFSRPLIQDIGFSRNIFGSNLILSKLGLNTTLIYSLRKVSNSYNGFCIRVRRMLDSVEKDIGFNSNNELDQSTLSSFAGADSAFVTTWYDQGPNSINAIQATAMNQPRIVNLGTIDTLNSKPNIEFLGVNYLTIATGNLVIYDAYVSVVFKRVSGNSGSGIMFSFRKLNNLGLFDDRADSGFGVRSRNDANSILNISTTQDTNQNVGGYGIDSANLLLKLSINGTITSGTAPSAPNTIERGALGCSAFTFGNTVFVGKIQEFFLFPSFLSTANRQTLERDQGSYYGITVL